jgi:hypothetical protein
MIVGPKVEVPQDVSLLETRVFHVGQSVGTGQSDRCLDGIVRWEQGQQLGRMPSRDWPQLPEHRATASGLFAKGKGNPSSTIFENYGSVSQPDANIRDQCTDVSLKEDPCDP